MAWRVGAFVAAALSYHLTEWIVDSAIAIIERQ